MVTIKGFRKRKHGELKLDERLYPGMEQNDNH